MSAGGARTSWWTAVLAAAVLVTTAIATTRWAVIPPSHTASMQQSCSACHAGSAPRTHTREFIARAHGPAALANRRECLGCHQDPAESCDRCHREQAPDWHTEDFLNPALGVPEMTEHIRIARGHRESCRECHTETYMTRCADCHRPDEGWLGRGDAGDGPFATTDRSAEEGQR